MYKNRKNISKSNRKSSVWKTDQYKTYTNYLTI
jgi:hypothetical protein